MSFSNSKGKIPFILTKIGQFIFRPVRGKLSIPLRGLTECLKHLVCLG